MSELIVGKITPPPGQPLVIDGQKTIKVDVIQDHIGVSKPVANLAVVRPEVDAASANTYEFVFYDSSGILSFKAPTGFIDIRALNTPVVPEGYQELSLTNFQVTTTWQTLPVSLNMFSGTYAFQATVIDTSNLKGIYSGVMPFLNKADQPILTNSSQQISVARIGEDSSVLEFRITRSLSGNSINLEVKGSSTPILPHKSILIKLRSML